MYAPARAFVGFAWDVVGQMLAVQVTWIAITWVVLLVVFGRATKRLVAHGG
jgi:ABC-type uncharacterized transport system permease subunit